MNHEITRRIAALDILITHMRDGTLEEQPYGGMSLVTACYGQNEDGHLDPSSWSDRKVLSAYYGNLGHTEDMHKILLPKWQVRLDSGGGQEGPYVRLYLPSFIQTEYACREFDESSVTMARAWMICIVEIVRRHLYEDAIKAGIDIPMVE